LASGSVAEYCVRNGACPGTGTGSRPGEGCLLGALHAGHPHTSHIRWQAPGPAAALARPARMT